MPLTHALFHYIQFPVWVLRYLLGLGFCPPYQLVNNPVHVFWTCFKDTGRRPKSLGSETRKQQSKEHGHWVGTDHSHQPASIGGWGGADTEGQSYAWWICITADKHSLGNPSRKQVCFLSFLHPEKWPGWRVVRASDYWPTQTSSMHKDTPHAWRTASTSWCLSGVWFKKSWLRLVSSHLEKVY